MLEVNLNQSPQTTQPPQNPKRNWKKILLILLVVLFLISLVGVGIYLLIPKPAEEPPTTQPQKQTTPSAKPATPSAKKDETAGWKTFTNSRDGYSVKYPPTLFKGAAFGDVGFFTEYFSNYKFDPNIGLANCLNGPGKDKADCYDITITKGPEERYEPTTISIGGSQTEGGSTTKRFSDASYSGSTWMRFTQDGHGSYSYYLSTKVIKGSFYTINASSKNQEAVNSNKKIIDLMAYTVKFLD